MSRTRAGEPSARLLVGHRRVGPGGGRPSWAGWRRSMRSPTTNGRCSL